LTDPSVSTLSAPEAYRHLVDKKPVSDVCDKHGIQPSLFYSWTRQLCDNIETALQDGRSHGNGVLERKIAKLEKQVAESDDLITDKQRVNGNSRRSSPTTPSNRSTATGDRRS
jgi:transposase-like protein